MQLSPALRRRLRWFNLPTATLITLLQRTPVVSMLATVEELVCSSPVVAVLKSAAAIGTLGALHSRAGATQLSATKPSPNTVTTGSPIVTVAFTVTDTNNLGSYKITGSVPPGLKFTEAGSTTGITGPGDVDAVILALSGTPTTAGTYNMGIQAFQFASSGGLASDTYAYTVIVTGGSGGSSAPTITTQPLSQTVNTGANVTFTTAAGGSPAPTFQWRKDGTNISGATSSTLTLTSVTSTNAGTYSVVATNSAGSATSSNAVLTVSAGASAPTITTQPQSQTVNTGATVTFTSAAGGSPAPTFQWRKDGTNISGATSSTLTLTSVTSTNAGTYSVVATNSAGSATSNNAVLTVNAAGGPAPTITAQPRSVTVNGGGTVALVVVATSTSTASYQWRKDGVAITGATSDTLILSNTAAGDAAAYTVVVTNAGGSVTSSAATLSVTSGQVSRISNLSVRTSLGSGQLLTVGFVTSGAKNLLLRANGPALFSFFGLTGFYPDPKIAVINSGSSLTIGQNDNWDSTQLTSTFVSLGAFAWVAGSKDAALLPSINGPHTAQINGTGSGVLLMEVYDADSTSAVARLTNVSARNQVGTGADILISGFVVDGAAARTLLIRGIGPALHDVFGVNGQLVDPILEIHQTVNGQDTVVASNDNWNTNLGPIFSGVGAYQFASGSKDAALLVTLPPGVYTAQVSGANSGTGDGVVEVYVVQ